MKVLTYLINLEGSDERLASATQQLNHIDWPFERVPAYDGRGKPLADFERYNDQQAKANLGRSLLNSEIGCYLSHYQCVQRFLQSDADVLIVLEDDLRLTVDFQTVMPQLLDFLDNNPALEWYLINIASNKKKLVKDITTFKGHTLARAYYFPILGLGLIWSKAGAKAFINEGAEISMPVDVFFQQWLSRNAQGLSIRPALVSPADLGSDIWQEKSGKAANRKVVENRDWTYSLKKQKRLWQNKAIAFKHLHSSK